MASSQFTVYSSSDANGPGPIFGAANEVVRVLDLILVTGYTGKAAAGWTKPIANSGNTGCYKPGGGSQMTLFINDNGLNVTSTTREAWAVGWEVITAVTGAAGTGSGQFPTPAQLLATGHVVIRKSALADGTTGRSWVAFADLYTLYFFISAGDTSGVGVYNGTLFFGDIFSLKGSSDAYRCIIVGAAQENTSAIAAQTANSADLIANFGVSTGNSPGHYMPRAYGGMSTSIQVFKQGDLSKCNASSTSAAMTGAVQLPNGPDNAIYMSAVSVAEFTNACLRGRMRGMYHICHLAASFADGQTFQGANDFAGKTIQVVKLGPLSGMFGIEISATVETN